MFDSYINKWLLSTDDLKLQYSFSREHSNLEFYLLNINKKIDFLYPFKRISCYHTTFDNKIMIKTISELHSLNAEGELDFKSKINSPELINLLSVFFLLVKKTFDYHDILSFINTIKNEEFISLKT